MYKETESKVAYWLRERQQTHCCQQEQQSACHPFGNTCHQADIVEFCKRDKTQQCRTYENDFTTLVTTTLSLLK